MNIQKGIQALTKDNEKIYSDLARVVRTYRKVDCESLGINYDPQKHILCDVELVKDEGYILYDVRLTPHILDINDVIADGTRESAEGNVHIQVPQIGSYVFISYLDSENAFVSMQSNAESITIGTPETGYFNFFTMNNKRIIELVNTQEFNVLFPNGKYFTLTTDLQENTVAMKLLFDYIEFLTKNAGIIISENDVDIFVKDGKINIHNDNYSLAKDILTPIINNFISYINSVNTKFLATGQPNPLIPTSVINSLNEINNKINTFLI